MISILFDEHFLQFTLVPIKGSSLGEKSVLFPIDRA